MLVTSPTYWGNVLWHHHLEHCLAECTNAELISVLYDPAISLLEIKPTESLTFVHQKTCTITCTAALLVIAKT